MRIRPFFAWVCLFADCWCAYIDVLSAALDSGLAISTIFIFFVLNFPKNGTIGANSIQTWWGNTVFANTVDWNATPLLTMPDGQPFGYVPPRRCLCPYADAPRVQPQDVVLISLGIWCTLARRHVSRTYILVLYFSKHNPSGLLSVRLCIVQTRVGDLSP